MPAQLAVLAAVALRTYAAGALFFQRVKRGFADVVQVRYRPNRRK